MVDNIINIRGSNIQDNSSKKYRYFTYFNITLLWTLYLGFILFEKKCNFGSLVPSKNYPFFFTIFSNCNECKDLRYQIWRLYTYSLVHYGYKHILSNSIFFLIFSSGIELVICSLNIFIIYLFGIITAPLFCIYFIPYTPIVGSSAGVYSLFGCFFGIGILDFYHFSSKQKRIYLIIIIYLITVFLLEIYYFTINTNTNIAYYGHFSGFVEGLLITNIIVKPKQRLTYHKYTKIFSSFIFIIINIIIISNYIFLYSVKAKKYSSECCYIK
tara:strand:+ start:528 stop:1337 length:810 start_codon:yes stop_codon:yes gene_type:complete